MVTTIAGPQISLKRCAIVLPPGCDNEDLGQAGRVGLSLALNSSKELPPEQYVSHQEGSLLLAQAFGLKTVSASNRDLKNFDIDVQDNNFVLSPTIRRRGPLFSGFRKGWDKGHEPVVLPLNCSDADLGAAMRMTLSRCL